MSTHWKSDTRDHFRLLWCQHEQCAYHRIIMGGVVSHTEATKHARKNRDHEVLVIDLELLTEEHRYKHVTVEQLEIPPF